MILYLGIVKDNQAVVIIKNNNNQIIVKKIFLIYRQAEKFLLKIDKLLKKNKIKLKDFEKIEVENSKGSFTSLRICVAIANALGYALNIPVVGTVINNKNNKSKINEKFNVVEPIYEQEPNITVRKVNKAVDKFVIF